MRLFAAHARQFGGVLGCFESRHQKCRSREQHAVKRRQQIGAVVVRDHCRLQRSAIASGRATLLQWRHDGVAEPTEARLLLEHERVADGAHATTLIGVGQRGSCSVDDRLLLRFVRRCGATREASISASDIRSFGIALAASRSACRRRLYCADLSAARDLGSVRCSCCSSGSSCIMSSNCRRTRSASASRRARSAASSASRRCRAYAWRYSGH